MQRVGNKTKVVALAIGLALSVAALATVHAAPNSSGGVTENGKRMGPDGARQGYGGSGGGGGIGGSGGILGTGGIGGMGGMGGTGGMGGSGGTVPYHQ